MKPGGGVPMATLCAEAAANLRTQARRSILALLGIVIGAAAIVALLNLAHIAQTETLKRFQRMGVDMLVVQASPVGAAPARLDRARVEALPGLDPDIVAATPLAVGRSSILAGTVEADAMIAAVPPRLFDVAELPVAEGRPILPLDDCGLVAVLGAALADELSARGDAARPGGMLHIGNYGYTLIGVLPAVSFDVLSPVDYNQAVLIPLACAQRVLSGPDPTVALIETRKDARPEAVGERVTERLANPVSSVQVQSARGLVRALNAQQAVHARMLAGIGAISLLVGGIGVLNVMLMSVMERRREIGLRAAIGATPGEIRLLFFIEAILLSVSGGVIGGLLGVAATVLFAAVSGWEFALALWVLPLGPGLAALVGIVFGLYPALAASRIDPIEALRAE